MPWVESIDPRRERGETRAHADKEVIFEAESSRTSREFARSGLMVRLKIVRHRGPPTSDLPHPAPNCRMNPSPRSNQHGWEAVPHIVERDENFWTISRLYYGLGRYYQALWRANAKKYPRIDNLRVKDVIDGSSRGGSRCGIHHLCAAGWPPLEPSGPVAVVHPRRRQKALLPPPTRLAPDDADNPNIRLVFDESDTDAPLQSDQRRCSNCPSAIPVLPRIVTVVLPVPRSRAEARSTMGRNSTCPPAPLSQPRSVCRHTKFDATTPSARSPATRWESSPRRRDPRDQSRNHRRPEPSDHRPTHPIAGGRRHPPRDDQESRLRDWKLKIAR